MWLGQFQAIKAGGNIKVDRLGSLGASFQIKPLKVKESPKDLEAAQEKLGMQNIDQEPA